MSFTIDDFTAATQNLSVTDGVQENFKKAPPGSPLIGDSRLIVLQVEKPGVPALAKAATLDIGDGYLVFQSGIKVLSRIEVFYGRGSNSEAIPLHHNLSGYKKFRLHFLASDLELNINMQVRTENNPKDLAGSSPDDAVHPSGDPFVVDFAFDTFVPNVGPLPDFADINEITLIIQGSGPAIGANDYVLTRIEALP
jgi:hypothetical protein